MLEYIYIYIVLGIDACKKNYTLNEKTAAWIVTNLIKVKRKIGTGYGLKLLLNRIKIFQRKNIDNNLLVKFIT